MPVTNVPVIEHKFKFGRGVDKKSHLTGVIVPDVHCAPADDTQGGVDPYAWSVFRQSLELIRPDFCVIIGDFSECTSVNGYQWSRRQRPPLEITQDRLLKEFEASNDLLDDLERGLPPGCQKVFIEGNHELWVDNLFAENKHTDPKFRPENGLRLKARGWTYYKHGPWIKVGHVYLNHGTQAKGVNHPRAMLMSHGKNLIYGHTHDLCAYPMRTLAGIIKAYSCGSLCLRDKEFLRGATTNWEHGFMTLHLHDTGYFTPEQHSINYGTTWIKGRRIKA